MSERSIFHVSPVGLGGWRVERVGTGESQEAASREEAEQKARALAEGAGTATVLVHDAEGRIQNEWRCGEADETH